MGIVKDTLEKRGDLSLKVPGPKHSIKRNGRRYLVSNGKDNPIECVSVTTILDQKANPGLQFGAQKVVAHYALDNYLRLAKLEPDDAYKELFHSPKRNWGDKAKFGTAVHEAIDAWLKSGTEEPTDVSDIDMLPYLAGAVRFLDDHISEVIATETTVANLTHEYAGTIDLIAKTKKGQVAIIDWKTKKEWEPGTKRVYPDRGLQITGYANCDLAVTEEGGTLPTEYGIPDMGIVVSLVGDANYEAYPVLPNEDDWKTFQALRQLQRWADTREKHILGEPKTGKETN